MPNASAGDIIKKAKSLGLVLTANHVYAVRAIDKRRGRPARLGGRTDTTQTSAAPKRDSKTDFIRGFAHDTPAAEVVEQAKRAGVKISKAYVYRVRALTSSGAAVNGERKPGRHGRAGGGATGGHDRKDPRIEKRLAALALEIGLLRATVLLNRMRAKLEQ